MLLCCDTQPEVDSTTHLHIVDASVQCCRRARIAAPNQQRLLPALCWRWCWAVRCGRHVGSRGWLLCVRGLLLWVGGLLVAVGGLLAIGWLLLWVWWLLLAVRLLLGVRTLRLGGRIWCTPAWLLLWLLCRIGVRTLLIHHGWPVCHAVRTTRVLTQYYTASVAQLLLAVALLLTVQQVRLQ